MPDTQQLTTEQEVIINVCNKVDDIISMGEGMELLVTSCLSQENQDDEYCPSIAKLRAALSDLSHQKRDISDRISLYNCTDNVQMGLHLSDSLSVVASASAKLGREYVSG